MNWMTLVATIVVPTVSVAATAWVAIKTKLIDASTRQADRQQELKLDFERRIWPDKSGALGTLIAACERVRQRAQVASAADADKGSLRGVIEQKQHFSRGLTIWGLDEFTDTTGAKDGSIGKLLAYAAEPVRQAVDTMLDKIAVLGSEYWWDVRELTRSTLLLEDAVGRLPPLPAVRSEEQIEGLRQLSAKQEAAIFELGKSSVSSLPIDEIDGIVVLCDKVIDAARKDLRGDYGAAATN